jgi:hypothetical protein
LAERRLALNLLELSSLRAPKAFNARFLSKHFQTFKTLRVYCACEFRNLGNRFKPSRLKAKYATHVERPRQGRSVAINA